MGAILSGITIMNNKTEHENPSAVLLSKIDYDYDS